MTDAKSPEPSIEEILASIRKIISDDDPEPEASHETVEADDGVLELTDVVFDVSTADTENDVHEEEPAPVAPPPRPVAPVIVAPEPEMPSAPPIPETGIEDIASEATLAAASGAFAKLSHIAVPAHDSHVPSSGGKSVEDIVRELLRPILRQWIDQNLAGIVERSVERELRKISRKAEDS